MSDPSDTPPAPNWNTLIQRATEAAFARDSGLRELFERAEGEAAAVALTQAMVHEIEEAAKAAGVPATMLPEASTSAAIARAVDAVAAELRKAKRKRGRPRRGLEVVPQQTWPEFEAVVFGMFADGPTLAHWRRITGELALAHKRPGSKLSLRFGALEEGTEVVPLRVSSHEELERRIMELGGPRTLHRFNYCLARARQEPGGFTVTPDELVNVSGPPPRSAHEAEQRKREAWEDLRLFCHIFVAGRRPSYPAKKGEPDILATWGPLLAFLEVADTQGQLALDGSVPPREATLAAGPWLARVVNERPADYMPYFANVLTLARLPDTQPRYAWLKAVAWALNQRWRTNAKGATEKRQGMDDNGNERPSKLQTRDFTRRELLDYLNPEPHYADILAGSDPRRAIRLWDEAIALLRQHGVIGTGRGDYKEHGPAPWRQPKDWPKGKPFKPQGWQEAWLDQKITIRPGAEGQSIIEGAHTSAKKHASAKKRRPRRAK